MDTVKKGVVTSEFWLTAGGAAYLYEAPSGLHALALAIVVGSYALGRALSKAGGA